MPRNASGTYSLPAGNPVVSGTTIASVWANTTLADIGTALTGSLARNGDGGMTGQLKAASGTVGAPGISWSSETTSGLYRVSAGTFGFSIAATTIWQADGSGTVFPKTIFATNSATTAILVGTTTINPNPIVGDPPHIVDIVNNASANQVIRVSTYGAPGAVFQNNWHWFRAGGTVAAPTAVLSGDFFMSLGTRGYDGTVSSQSSGAFSATATENWSATAHGTRFDFQATPNGSIVRAACFGISARGAELIDGAVGSPSLAFISDTDTGLWHAGANQPRMSCGGADVMIWATTFVAARQVFQAADGSVGTPGVSFENDADTGIYRVGSDDFALVTNGVNRLDISNTAVIFNSVPMRGLDGNAGTPAYSFVNDTDTGMYRQGADGISFSCGGALSLELGSGFIQVPGTILGKNGSTNSPTFAFNSDPDTGWYQSTKMALSIDNARAFSFNGVSTTGAQTATFVATNKPGSGTAGPISWIPVTTAAGTQGYIPIFGA